MKQDHILMYQRQNQIEEVDNESTDDDEVKTQPVSEPKLISVRKQLNHVSTKLKSKTRAKDKHHLLEHLTIATKTDFDNKQENNVVEFGTKNTEYSDILTKSSSTKRNLVAFVLEFIVLILALYDVVLNLVVCSYCAQSKNYFIMSLFLLGIIGSHTCK